MPKTAYISRLKQLRHGKECFRRFGLANWFTLHMSMNVPGLYKIKYIFFSCCLTSPTRTFKSPVKLSSLPTNQHRTICLAPPYLADDCILASSDKLRCHLRGHMHRSEDPYPFWWQEFLCCRPPGSGTAYRRICDGQTFSLANSVD